MLLEELKKIAAEARREAEAILNSEELESFRIKYLGKKGELTAILKGMASLADEARREVGRVANQIREELTELIERRRAEADAADLELRLKAETLDVTLPGNWRETGRRHPIAAITNELCGIFRGMGYEIAEGPEVEYDYYNFEALNIPRDHPARDTQDTFYISNSTLLRTQTSPVQIRMMERKRPPIKMVAPGRVYRADEIDATHSPTFHQLEGLVVDRGVRMSDLKGALEATAAAIFGRDAKIRLRPHHFPFTEPSAEVDICCFACDGKGCRLCKGEGWIEILGAGMVHPWVLENCGINPEEYSGFAFGMGLERIAMRRYGIDDMRLLYENDLRFLAQF